MLFHGIIFFFQILLIPLILEYLRNPFHDDPVYKTGAARTFFHNGVFWVHQITNYDGQHDQKYHHYDILGAYKTLPLLPPVRILIE